MGTNKKMYKHEFLKFKLGETVLVGEYEIQNFLSLLGGARDPYARLLFQVAFLEIKFVYDDEVKQILTKREYPL